MGKYSFVGAGSVEQRKRESEGGGMAGSPFSFLKTEWTARLMLEMTSVLFKKRPDGIGGGINVVAKALYR